MTKVLKKAFFKAIIAFSLIASAFLLVSVETEPFRIPNADDNYGRPNAVGSPAYFVEKHDCWTGEAPAGVTPRHAVITEANVTRYVGPVKTQQALAHVFGEPTEIDTVHAFCR